MLATSGGTSGSGYDDYDDDDYQRSSSLSYIVSSGGGVLRVSSQWSRASDWADSLCERFNYDNPRHVIVAHNVIAYTRKSGCNGRDNDVPPITQRIRAIVPRVHTLEWRCNTVNGLASLGNVALIQALVSPGVHALSLRRLRLRSCNLDAQTTRLLADGLCRLPHLEELNVRGNPAIGVDACVHLVRAFSRECSSARVLDVHGCASRLGDNSSTLVRLLGYCTRLEVIRAGGLQRRWCDSRRAKDPVTPWHVVHAAAAAAAAAATTVPLCRNLVDLHLQACGINSEHLLHRVCPVLKHSASLETLNLRRNRIGGGVAAMRALCDVLSTTRVRALDLSWNMLDGVALEALGRNLRTDTEFVLSVAHNVPQQCHQGCTVSRRVVSCAHLRRTEIITGFLRAITRGGCARTLSLDIRGFVFGHVHSEGVQALLHLIKTHPVLIALKMSPAGAPRSSTDSVMGALIANPAITARLDAHSDSTVEYSSGCRQEIVVSMWRVARVFTQPIRCCSRDHDVALLLPNIYALVHLVRLVACSRFLRSPLAGLVAPRVLENVARLAVRAQGARVSRGAVCLFALRHQ